MTVYTGSGLQLVLGIAVLAGFVIGCAVGVVAS